MTGRLISLIGLAIAAGAVLVAPSGGHFESTAQAGIAGRAAGAALASCPQGQPGSSYLRRVRNALGSNRDAWGKQLLATRTGPTYERAQSYLRPLFLARAKNGRSLTDSGVYYLPFSEPESSRGATTVALHVADGSQIISRRVHRRRMTIAVGLAGHERYGSCLQRLRQPLLADGYLPILETRYVDRHGVRYRQQSFATHVPETRSLVSMVRLIADATDARVRLVRLRFTPSVSGLTRTGDRLSRNGRTYLFFSPGGTFGAPSLKYGVRRGTVRTVIVAWLNTPMKSADLVLDETRYEEARESVREFWERRIAHGGKIVVPERRVVDAERNLLVQNTGLTWRYSIGNPYEQLSTPEAIDVARVLAEYGNLQAARAILRTSLRKRPAVAPTATTRSTNWRMGARLVGFAQYAQLSGDRSEVRRATPVLRGHVRRLGRQIRASSRGLLERERFSSDVSERVYGLHSQAVVWQGLRSMAQEWQEAGYPRLAAECRRVARKLEAGLRRAVRRSATRLPDGSLFIPVKLLDDERPYRHLSASREGSYWNLVMPYALASGLFPPHGRQVEGVLEYMRDHGSRLLGLVRTGAYSLYGTSSRPTSGLNPVYGLNVSRVLADNDRPAELVLSLYGQLAVQMTPGTFVSGESVSIAPLRGAGYRAAYLPPNSASNASFLETLRLMLVHETTDRDGAQRGLELAYSTPRPWLRDGGHVEVRRMATSFGRLSFAIDASADTAAISLSIPRRAPLRVLRLRLRVPGGKPIASVTRDGLLYGRVLADGETIELPPRPGDVELEVALGRR